MLPEGLLFFGILEWFSWSGWRRVATLYPIGSETMLMIFTGSLRVFMDPQIGKPGKIYGRIWGAIRGMWGDSWCIGGDFHVLRFPGKRNREGRWTGTMRRFPQIIDELELKDLPLQGGVFTWIGGPGNQRMARLDRFLITDDWDNYFGNATQSTLPRPFSDHFPILLIGGGSLVRGPTPFRFENMWLKTEGFKILIDGWWKSFDVRGASSFVVVEKLKALKIKLKD